MAFSVNLTSLFTGVTTTAADAALIAQKTQTYIVLAEQAGAALKSSGSDKLAMVKAMLLADLNAVNPALGAEITAAWAKIEGIIAAIIQFFNLIGWMFSIVAPFVEIAVPGSVPAITAITAAGKAITAAEAAVSGAATTKVAV